MKLQDMRELSQDELTAQISDARKQIVEMRFQQALRKLESPARLRNAKRLLAQLLTVQTEKTLKQA